MSRARLTVLNQSQPELLFDSVPDDLQRPLTRADCEDGERPCPWVSCKYHLYLSVLPNGNIQHHFRGEFDAVFADGRPSCALDVAEKGGVSLEVAAQAIGIERERARQIEEKALRVCREDDGWFE